MEVSRQGLKGGPKTNMKNYVIFMCVCIYIYKIPPPPGKKNPDLSPLINGIWFLIYFLKDQFCSMGYSIPRESHAVLFFSTGHQSLTCWTGF